MTLALLCAGCGGGEGAGGDTGEPGGARFPFPQNHTSAFCALPAYDNADVRAAYDVWKADLVTAAGAGGFLRVRRPDTPDGLADSTVSEGIAYGMILAVYMDDQELFDNLWKYSQLWLDERGLMKWYIDPEGEEACPGEDSCGSATDSDEDIAWALVMADRQWGGGGTLDDTYLSHAKQQIDRVFRFEIENGTSAVKPGDRWGGYAMTNPSYFAPAYYRVFGEVSGDVAGWSAVIDRSYEILANSLNAENGNQDNGLVPAWCNGEGKPTSVDDLPTHYQYDSARMPFRIAQDYCWTGEPRAKDYLDRVSAFFAGVGADNIVDGYDLDGTPRPEASPEGARSAVFVGCAGVGAMSDPERRAFVDRTYEHVATLDLLVRSRYYQRSWTAMTLLMMSGGFVDFTKLP
jgi:endo-1,4-beta-D-glucanase Y